MSGIGKAGSVISDESLDETADEAEGGGQATDEAARSGTREAGEADRGGPHSRPGRIMRKAFHEVSERAGECGIPMRAAAYELGIERVVEASRTRGYIS